MGIQSRWSHALTTRTDGQTDTFIRMCEPQALIYTGGFHKAQGSQIEVTRATKTIRFVASSSTRTTSESLSERPMCLQVLEPWVIQQCRTGGAPGDMVMFTSMTFGNVGHLVRQSPSSQPLILVIKRMIMEICTRKTVTRINWARSTAMVI